MKTCTQSRMWHARIQIQITTKHKFVLMFIQSQHKIYET
jgi:hypothetical protein